MDCISLETAAGFCSNALPGDARRVVEEHIQACAQCAALVRESGFARLSAALDGTTTGSSETLAVAATGGAAPGRAAGAATVGDTVLGYRLLETLGRGGMGVAFLARREFEVESVAVKLLPPSFRGHPDELAQVRRVFEIAKTLRHPHIAMVYQLGEDPLWGPLLVMEYVRDVTLRRFRQERGDEQGRLPLEQALRILEPVADALDYSHAMRVVHRDVKPSNIMLCEDGSGVRLIDFGLGDEIRHSVTNLSLVEAPVAGTAPYMSPEQWRGHAASAASDQYALGCVAYELLTGRTPFVAGDAGILRHCHLSEPPPPIDASPPLQAVFWHASPHAARPCVLAKSREQRFSTCQAFIQALRAGATAVIVRGQREAKARALREASAGVSRPPRPRSAELPFVALPRQLDSVDATEFRRAQAETAIRLRVPRSLKLAGGITLVLIPRGSFWFGLGCEPYVDESGSERPREVIVERPYYLARWPMTHAEWESIFGAPRSRARLVAAGRGLAARLLGRTPAPGADRGIMPVSDLTLAAAQSAVPPLNVWLAGSPDVSRAVARVRLPSEEQWEFACRAGSTALYCFGSDETRLARFGWYSRNSGGKLQPTAMLGANAADLFDMHGNVWEWLADGQLRGGCFESRASELTSFARRDAAAAVAARHTGVRIAGELAEDVARG